MKMLIHLVTMMGLITMGLATAQAADSNLPPQVSILWPSEGDGFRAGTLIKIEADASDRDGSIRFVQLFADTNLIAVATNAPFNTMWYVDLRPFQGIGPWNLKAVAVDNLGARAESTPITIWYWTGAPPMPVVKVASPRNGTVFAAPASFVFAAELLASSGEAGLVEFFVGTNSLGQVTQTNLSFTVVTPPYSMTVTNVPEGEYVLSVKYLGEPGVMCRCGSTTIRVAKLGIQSPSLGSDGQIHFEVVTSYPGRQTVVETSPNLVNWIPVSTNVPSGNAFTFIDPSPATNRYSFYRVFVPPQ